MKFTGAHQYTRILGTEREDQKGWMFFYSSGWSRMGFRLYNGTGEKRIYINAGISPNWNHYCGTYNSTTGTILLYINGEVTSWTSISNPESTGYTQADGSFLRSFSIGSSSVSTWPESSQWKHFTGQLFDVRYFNRELTAAEAVRIYNGDVLGDEILRMPLNKGDVTKNLGSWTHSSPKPGLPIQITQGNMFDGNSLVYQSIENARQLFFLNSETITSALAVLQNQFKATQLNQEIQKLKQERKVQKLKMSQRSQLTAFIFVLL